MKPLNVLELFAGTRSIGRAFEARGHNVLSVDWDEHFEEIDICDDVLNVYSGSIKRRLPEVDVVWASPDCTTYSIAAISHHRTKEEHGNLLGVSDYARKCDRVNLHMHNLIMMFSPCLWFIENPRGGMRKMDFMHGLARYTTTYCQYGDTRMKPTDIWTNHPNPRLKPPCSPGDPCHISAPRGAKTGTQGLSGSIERSRIPEALCNHIVLISEKYHARHSRRGGVLRIQILIAAFNTKGVLIMWIHTDCGDEWEDCELCRTTEERLEALDKACRLRRERVEIKRQLACGKVSVRNVLKRGFRHEEPYGGMRLKHVICALRGYGPVKTKQLLTHLGIDENKRLRSLGERQIEKLIKHLNY